MDFESLNPDELAERVRNEAFGIEIDEEKLAKRRAELAAMLKQLAKINDRQ